MKFIRENNIEIFSGHPIKTQRNFSQTENPEITFETKWISTELFARRIEFHSNDKILETLKVRQFSNFVHSRWGARKKKKSKYRSVRVSLGEIVQRRPSVSVEKIVFLTARILDSRFHFQRRKFKTSNRFLFCNHEFTQNLRVPFFSGQKKLLTLEISSIILETMKTLFQRLPHESP